jgi:hypothetical protein
VRLAELKEKWKAKSTDDLTVIGEGITIYRVPKGDLVHSYVTHLMIPWRKRFWWSEEWYVVGALMRNVMNTDGEIVWVE